MSKRIFLGEEAKRRKPGGVASRVAGGRRNALKVTRSWR